MSDELKKTLGQRLRELRKERGWTQAQAAEEADLSPTFYASVERQEKGPGLDSIFQLANGFGVAPAELFVSEEILLGREVADILRDIPRKHRLGITKVLRETALFLREAAIEQSGGRAKRR